MLYALGIPMDHKDAQEKARNFLIENSWDTLLVEAYIALHFYPVYINDFYWQDLEHDWNIGVINISSATREINVGKDKGEVLFTRCEFGNIKFMIGGKIEVIDMSMQAVVTLFIGEKRVLEVVYDYINPDAHAPLLSQYTMVTVEEFHATPKIGELLWGLHDAIEIHKKKREKIERLKIEDEQKGKFTFD